MNKAKMNYFLDLAMVFLFLVSAFTGILLFFMGSGGFQGGRNPNFRNNLLGIPRNSLRDFHNYSGIVLIIIILIHIILHFDWILNMTKSFFRKNNKK
jgi:cytochrome b subunit of formate dehydrogenase